MDSCCSRRASRASSSASGPQPTVGRTWGSSAIIATHPVLCPEGLPAWPGRLSCREPIATPPDRHPQLDCNRLCPRGFFQAKSMPAAKGELNKGEAILTSWSQFSESLFRRSHPHELLSELLSP